MFKIPKRLDDLLPAAAVEKVLDVLHQPEMYQNVKDAIGKVGTKDIHPFEKVQSAWQQTRMWLDTVVSTDSASTAAKGILNASGQLIHEDGSGVPMSSVLAFAYARAASTYRQRSQVESRARVIVKECTSAGSVSWVTDAASAIAACAERFGVEEILVPRTDLVRLPGIGDVYKMLGATARHIIEVGASNDISGADWKSAFSDTEQMVVLAGPNGQAHGKRAKLHEEAIEAANAAGKKVVYLLADGVVSQSVAEQIKAPEVRGLVEQGCIVALPLNLLVAGPQGVALLAKDSIDGIDEMITSTGRRMSPASIATAATALQMGASAEGEEGSTATFLSATLENLENRATRLATQLSGIGGIETAEPVRTSQALGIAPWDCYQLESWSVRLSGDTTQILRTAAANDPVILLASTDEGPCIDLRFVDAADDYQIVEAFTGDAGEAD